MTIESLRLFLNRRMRKRVIAFALDDHECKLEMLGQFRNKLEMFDAIMDGTGVVVTVHFLLTGVDKITEHVQETVVGLVFVCIDDAVVKCTFVSNNGKRTKLTKPVELFDCIEDLVLR